MLTREGPAGYYTFDFQSLPRLAPWVYEEIRSIGVERIEAALRRRGDDPAVGLPIATWVWAIRSVRQTH